MRELKFQFVCDPGTKFAKMYPFTREGVRQCRLDNEDENYTDEDYVWKILNGGFSNVTLLQFTDLTDSNGVEIYDGYIVRVDWGAMANEYAIESLGNPFQIEFRNHSWFPFGHYLPMPKNIEVIGNVYQNPELLTSLEKPE